MSTKLSVIKLQQWIETTINYELTTDSLYKALQSGVVLCKLIKKISGEKFDYHKITRGSDYKEEVLCIKFSLSKIIRQILKFFVNNVVN